ncbi:MAG TPA: flagellar hook capping FlgD N-terminal domain-containing protein [Solirubrobacteraceae bacterium]|nr:flagellar hook capping FlgD N-terminal domain-containing protein [Solirubrobacteraceae bacterium]
MTTQPVGSATSAGAVPAGEGQGQTLGKDDFLKLMIAELQAQNPLQPANGTEYVSELAQFTQLEQTTNLAQASERQEAVQLIGRTVSYAGSGGSTVTGQVQSVQQAGSTTTLTVNGIGGVAPASVTEVS